jgi:hypothetical protein
MRRAAFPGTRSRERYVTFPQAAKFFEEFWTKIRIFVFAAPQVVRSGRIGGANAALRTCDR